MTLSLTEFIKLSYYVKL